MCPNQQQELLPDCQISNRMLMYSMLQSLQEENQDAEKVDTQLRDRFEVFRQVTVNFPMPLHAGLIYEYVDDLSGAESSISLENNTSGSSDNMSNESSSSNLFAHCDYNKDAVRSALEEEQEEKQLLDRDEAT
ncbi:uncharacterized protein LOC6562258 [Drosophila grimshawi]|uniref:GH10644 n=1 Tax=Drosophila grimshawi TaxID=7222 RepID=B4JCK6_DROGR|nr:uncharacterized protein LOC6562258 [Drosophila grimshawi]EDW03160.1 GH10644 [Drosophila grimshawi]